MAGRRVLLIALDSLEVTWFRALMAAGRLPNLAAFAADGLQLSVRSDGDLLDGTVWPTFASGTRPGTHGVYWWNQWLAEEQRHVRNNHPALAYAPFWDGFPAFGLGATVIDAPFIPAVEGPRMRTLQAWGLHDEMEQVSAPSSFRAEVIRRFGKHPLSFDTVEPVTSKEKLQMTRELRRGVHLRAKLVAALANEPDWDLFLITFSELHKAGDYLAAPSQLGSRTSNVDALAAILGPLDNAWPRIVAAAGPTTDIFLFALHGIAPQVEYSAFGAQLAKLVMGQGPVDPAAHPDLIRRVRNSVPDAVHRAIWRRLPAKVRAARHGHLSEALADQRHDALFPIAHDGAAGLRVNLAGRERDGFVTHQERARLLSR
jgi:Type I phosphodiesterase / nucleotide pyrophosphatase